MSEACLSAFRKKVLGWYRAHARHDLPWRVTVSPYYTLVSEIMLQQTQVPRVAVLFPVFISAFPSLTALATTDLSRVLIAWQGLGYNRRAKFLHQSAQQCCAHFGGHVPKEVLQLETLPGIGPATARSIAAFGFNVRTSFIETNIRAVFLHHFFSGETNVPDEKLLPLVTACVEKVRQPRVWYSALMDYGTHLKSVLPNPSRASRHHSRQSAFHGSLRQVRGAVLRQLAAGPCTASSLSKIVAQFPRGSALPQVLQQLLAEKLISKKDTFFYLGD